MSHIYSITYIYDSGASHHFFREDEPHLFDIEPTSHQLRGTFNYPISRKAIHPDFGEVLIVDGWKNPNLISANTLKQTLYDEYKLDGNKSMLIPRTEGRNSYLINVGSDNISYLKLLRTKYPSFGKAYLAKTEKTDVAWILHEILAHASEKSIIQAITSGEYSSLGLSAEDVRAAGLSQCAGCIRGKMRGGFLTRKTRRNKTTGSEDEPEPEKESVQIGSHQHADVAYVMFRASITYYFISTDQATGFVFSRQMKNKSAKSIKEAIKALAAEHRGYQKEREEKTGIITLHTDPDSSILSLARSDQLVEIGVQHVSVSPDVHEKRAERTIQTIKSKARATLHGLDFLLPSMFLTDLIDYVILGINQTPNNKTAGLTPWRLVTTEAVDAHHFQVPFGCAGYFHNPYYTSSIGSPKASPGFTIGRYPRTRTLKAYIFKEDGTCERMDRDKIKPFSKPPSSKFVREVERLIQKDDKTFHSYDFIELETKPKKLMRPLNSDSDEEDSGIEGVNRTPGIKIGGVNPTPEQNSGNPILNPTLAERRGGGIGPFSDSSSVESRNNSTPSEITVTGDEEALPIVDTGAPVIAGNSSTDLNQKTTRVVEGIAEVVVSGNGSTSSGDSVALPSSAMGSEGTSTCIQGPGETDIQAVESNRSAGICNQSTEEGVEVLTHANREGKRRRPKIDYAKLDASGFRATSGRLAIQAYMARVASVDRAAIEDEMNQIMDQGVFEPVNLETLSKTDVNKALNTVMLLTHKYGPDGKFIKVKGRLVTKGYEDQDNQNETESPTVRPEVVMIGLNIAASRNYDIDLFDVGGAFLEADIKRPNLLIRVDEKIGDILEKRDKSYVTGRKDDKTMLVRLRKALYGLKESPRLWNETLTNELLNYGFTQSKHDPCLFIKQIETEAHYVLIHVDDILSTGPRESMNELKANLCKRFRKITHNINPTTFNYLGMTATRKRGENSIELRQRKYIDNIISKLEIKEDHHTKTPASQNLFEEEEKLRESLDQPLLDLYASITMTMLYITKTRPDIKCAVAYLSTRLHNATKDCWQKMLRTARYLNSTKDLPLVIRGSPMTLTGSADASFATHSDRKSQTGALLWLGPNNAPVYSTSKKQKLVTSSTAEAELVAANSATQEIVWIREVLNEMNFKQAAPTKLQQDNKSCIIMANRGHGGKFSRAVDIKYFWISEQIEKGKVELKYTPSEQLIADGLTKPLPPSKFVEWRDRILNIGQLQ